MLPGDEGWLNRYRSATNEADGLAGGRKDVSKLRGERATGSEYDVHGMVLLCIPVRAVGGGYALQKIRSGPAY